MEQKNWSWMCMTRLMISSQTSRIHKTSSSQWRQSLQWQKILRIQRLNQVTHQFVLRKIQRGAASIHNQTTRRVPTINSKSKQSRKRDSKLTKKVSFKRNSNFKGLSKNSKRQRFSSKDSKKLIEIWLSTKR